MTTRSDIRTAPTPRRYGRVNWIGAYTLYRKEVFRFLKVFVQTVAAPVVTTLLFYAIFALALGGVVRKVGNVSLMEFLAPGLIMMGMAQNAFANTSSSVIIAKVQGNIVDLLMPPLAPVEIAAAYVAGGVTRGLLVGLATAGAILFFVPLSIHSAFFVIYHGVMATVMLSLLGLIGGIWAEKFDHMAAVTNFIITPLTFLSGTFYSVDRLPPTFLWLAHLNPFFYMIDGFRYGFIGTAGGSLTAGVLTLLGINIALTLLAWRMLATGYKLKA